MWLLASPFLVARLCSVSLQCRFSVHYRSQFVVVAAYQKVWKRKFSIFFDFFGKLDVGVLFVEVVVESVNFVFVNGGKCVVNVA